MTSGLKMNWISLKTNNTNLRCKLMKSSKATKPASRGTKESWRSYKNWWLILMLIKPHSFSTLSWKRDWTSSLKWSTWLTYSSISCRRLMTSQRSWRHSFRNWTIWQPSSGALIMWFAKSPARLTFYCWERSLKISSSPKCYGTKCRSSMRKSRKTFKPR